MSTSDVKRDEAVENLETVAHEVQTAATKMQMDTEVSAVNDVAIKVKEVAHDALMTAENMKSEIEVQETSKEEPGSSSEKPSAKTAETDAGKEQKPEIENAQTAAYLEAAKKVEEELKEIESSMQDLAEDGDGNFLNAKDRCVSATERQKKLLELLASKKSKESIQMSFIFKVLWGAWLAFCTILLYFMGAIGSSELTRSIIMGILFGTGSSILYYYNRRKKNEKNQRFAMIPGVKGIQYLVHYIPSWISLSEKEKVEWLNRLIAKAWPYYDAAICAEVKTQVEPLLDESKPAFIKKIFFKKLTFGDAPFRIEGIKVYENTEEIRMDAEFRWSGDMGVHIAIELVGGGSATRMVPKVSDVTVSGTARIILAPLVPEIPGFGAATVSLMSPPIVKFHLDFGAAFGGSYSAKMIQAWLDPFLRSTVAGMFVWPNRMVVPLLSEDVTGPLDDLYLRHKGALQIDVISAKDIPRADKFGKSDPFVEVYTQSNYVEKTSVKKNTLAPVWNERVWCLVQEPDTQDAYITMSDVDVVNVKELFRFNVLKGATEVFGAKEVIGRAKIKVADFVNMPGEENDITIPLGSREFRDPDGCGGGCGELKLRVTYWPLDIMRGHLEAHYGALIVTLIRCDDLAVADVGTGASDPYVKFACNGETKKSSIVYANVSPRWLGARFDWFKVPSKQKLKIEVFDYDTLMGDDLLGKVTIDVYEEVASAPRGDITKSWKLQDVPKEWSLRSKDLKESTITMRIQWIPFAGL